MYSSLLKQKSIDKKESKSKLKRSNMNRESKIKYTGVLFVSYLCSYDVFPPHNEIIGVVLLYCQTMKGTSFNIKNDFYSNVDSKNAHKNVFLNKNYFRGENNIFIIVFDLIT